MAQIHVLCVFTIICCFLCQDTNASPVPRFRLCYYTSWSQYRHGAARFLPEDIEPTLCSHVVFSFAGLTGNQLNWTDWNDVSQPWRRGLYERVVALKDNSPTLQAVLAVGGWNLGVAQMTAMLNTYQTRQEFIRSSVNFLRNHSFDGLNLDFEYPGSRGSLSSDKLKFSQLLQELREAFHTEAVTTTQTELSLSVAISCDYHTIARGYDVPALTASVDWIGLMAYDLTGTSATVTSFHAPLKNEDSTNDNHSQYKNRTIEWCASHWLTLGASKEKLVVGLATYGRGFTLADSQHSGLYAPSNTASVAAQYTARQGLMAYYEICQFLSDGGTRVWREDYGAPYVYKDNLWYGFDDIQSLQKKVQWLLSERYAGYMVWSLDTDDFSGEFCGQGRYPLLTTMNNTLNGLPPPTGGHFQRTTSTSASTTTRATTTTKAAVAAPHCQGPSDHLVPDQSDCGRYLSCSQGVGTSRACTMGLLFSPDSGVCDWSFNLSEDRQYQCNGGD